MTKKSYGPGNPVPHDDTALEAVRQADMAWRSARVARIEAIRAAHRAGIGYGTIAKVLGVTRSYTQKVCSQARTPLEIDTELEAWREAERLRDTHA